MTCRRADAEGIKQFCKAVVSRSVILLTRGTCDRGGLPTHVGAGGCVVSGRESAPERLEKSAHFLNMGAQPPQFLTVTLVAFMRR
jgi:hypothetical protein